MLGEVGAVKDGVLQGAGLEKGLFGFFTGGIVRTDQQVPDDRIFIITEVGDGNHCGKAAAILADVGQVVNVFDAAGSLQHQGLEPRCDLRSELDAERGDWRGDFLRVGDVGGGDLVGDFRGGVTEHALRTHVENLDDSLGVGGDAEEVGTVENGALQRACLEERLFADFVMGFRDGSGSRPIRCSLRRCIQ